MLPVDPEDRKKLIEPLFRADRRFWILIVVLLLVISMGVVMYIRQVIEGLAITGMNRPAYWGLYMVNFVFFIGISLAGTLTSAILRITGVEWRRPITRMAETITVFALIIATLQIIIDMGRPDRLLYVVLHGRLQSPILWDVAIIMTYLLCSVTYLYLPLIPDLAIIRDNLPDNAAGWQRLLYRALALGWRGNIAQWHRLEMVVSLMAVFIVPVGVAVHTITSWLLATTVQPGWHSTVFGPYFVVTAIFSGIAALFLVMTAVRRTMGLQRYITLRQYSGLSWLFIAMAIIWLYFTYSETLTLIAGQQMMEFPVLASKLWGEHAPTFWLMLLFIGSALVITLVTQLLPVALRYTPILQPRFSLGSGVAAAGLILFLTDPQFSWVDSSSEIINLRAFGWAWVLLLLLIVALGITAWFKRHPVAAAVIAGAGVIMGTWLERWNIIVPTVTHPRNIAYSVYHPTLTEIGLTVASVALFVLLFVVFYKLFPAVSLWEVAEGRMVKSAQEQVSIPVPEPSVTDQRKRRWVFRQSSSISSRRS